MPNNNEKTTVIPGEIILDVTCGGGAALSNQARGHRSYTRRLR